MTKFIIETEDQDEAKLYLQSRAMNLALIHIVNDIFRPARKHGYADHKLNDMDTEIVGELEDIFWKILEDYEIKLEY